MLRQDGHSCKPQMTAVINIQVFGMIFENQAEVTERHTFLDKTASMALQGLVAFSRMSAPRIP